MAALDAGADDFNAQDDCFEVFTSPADFLPFARLLKPRATPSSPPNRI